MSGIEDINMITDVGLTKLRIPAPIFRFLRFNVFQLLLEFIKDTALGHISARRHMAVVSERMSMLDKILKEHDK